MLTVPVAGWILQARNGSSSSLAKISGQSIFLVRIAGASCEIERPSGIRFFSQPSPSGPESISVQSFLSPPNASAELSQIPNGGAILCQRSARSTSFHLRPKSRTSVSVPPQQGWRITPIEQQSPAAKSGASSIFGIPLQPNCTSLSWSNISQVRAIVVL